MPNETASAAEAFVQSIGVNTHLDFYDGPYGDLSAVEAALNYLGLSNVRDSAANAGDLPVWQQVAQATGVKFEAYIGQVPPSEYDYQLSTMQQAADQGLLNAVEGADEPEFGAYTGAAAGFQQNVSQLGRQLGLPVVNTSFGSINDYGSTGDLSSWADYANAHIYFGTGNNPGWADWIGTLEADAQSSATSRPTFITESGYYTTGDFLDPANVDETVQAKYTLDLVLDAWQSGAPRTYIYELLDQGTGDGNYKDNFGLFRSDGSPKPAATAIHNLISLLNDPGGAGISTGSLNYTLSGLQDTDNSMLMQKSDGTWWLAVWNDARLSGPFNAGEVSVPSHQVTLNLGSGASSIDVFDPMSGTNAVQSANDTSSITFDLPDHPVLIEIGGSADGGSSAGQSDPQIGANDAQPVITGDGMAVSASAGDHMIFLTGSGDTLNATGGTEGVQAYQGGNSITTGAGDDTIRIAGSGNTVDAGGGNNQIEDAGSANTIVLPVGGEGHDDLFGWTMQNGDTFDLRQMLAQTSWNGDASRLGDYIQVTMAGNDANVSVNPSGSAGSTTYDVATLHVAGAMDLSTLLAHAITS